MVFTGNLPFRTNGQKAFLDIERHLVSCIYIGISEKYPVADVTLKR